MELIQIRGSNGTGKTTAMRQFVEKRNLKIKEISVKGIKTFISASDDMKIIVLGKYDKKTGGCDLFKNKEHVIQTIFYVIKEYKPDFILFEGLIYGLTYNFAKVLSDEARKVGYKYKGICLYLEPEEAIKRIMLRNGGKDINQEYIYNKTKSFLTSYNKLKGSNVNVILYDTGGISYDKMGNILESEINEKKR